MVFIPNSSTTGGTIGSSPAIPFTSGLDENRDVTHWFIMTDPTPISLIPVAKIQQPSGGYKSVSLAPRPLQHFKLIYQSGIGDGIIEAQDGNVRRYDFVMVGEWDAVVEIDDYWIDPARDNFHWRVKGFQPYNGYEVKVGVVGFGGDPGNG